MSEMMEELHALTLQIMESLPSKKAFLVEQHEMGDPESPDIVWIRKYTDGGMCEGEYLAITPPYKDSNEWYVAHKSADVCGGHPTYWSASGTAEAMLAVVPDYIVSRSIELKGE